MDSLLEWLVCATDCLSDCFSFAALVTPAVSELLVDCCTKSQSSKPPIKAQAGKVNDMPWHMLQHYVVRTASVTLPSTYRMCSNTSNTHHKALQHPLQLPLWQWHGF